MADRPVVPLKPGNAGGGKGPWFKINARSRKGAGDWETCKLQKAFRNCRRRYMPKRRKNPSIGSIFCTTRCIGHDVLVYAYRSCKANKGAAGVDGQRFRGHRGVRGGPWLGELAERLRKKTTDRKRSSGSGYRSQTAELRPLGIPTITERVVQTAALLVLEPIFEADLQPEQYAYRPDRGAHDAIRAVHSLLNTGHTQVIDADLSGYFDSIPHAELMKCVARRIVDRHVLHLIKAWLVAPVEEDDGKGGTTRSRVNRDSKRGTPQGSPGGRRIWIRGESWVG